MSVAPNVLNNNWKVVYARAVQSNVAPPLNIKSAFLGAILNDNRANQAQSPYVNISMPDIATLLRNANLEQGKVDIEVAFDYYPIASVTQGFDTICANGARTQRKTGSFHINREIRMQSEEIGGESSLCEPQKVSDEYVRKFTALVKRSVERLIAEVEREIFAKDGANYRHIGNLPRIQRSAPVRPAGEVLPLFSTPVNGFQGAFNPLGEHNLERDKDAGMQPNDTYAVGSRVVNSYRRVISEQGMYRTDGYNFMNRENPIGNLLISSIISNPVADGGTGLRGALLIVPTGYLQFVSVNTNTPELNNVGTTGNTTRGTIVDPYLNISWDFWEYTNECALVKSRTLYLRLLWGILSMPKCNSDEPALEGVNGIYLYDADCSDLTLCDATNAEYLPEQAPAQNYAGCEDDDADSCGGGCMIDIRRVSQTATTLTLAANYVVSQGAHNFAQINWSINGTPAPAYDDDVNIEIPIASLVDGDEITVLLTDDLGCESTSAPFTYEA